MPCGGIALALGSNDFPNTTTMSGGMILSYSSSRSAVARWYWQSLRRNPRHLFSWLACLAAAFYIGWTRSGQSVTTGFSAVLGVAVFLALYPQLRFKPQTRTLELRPDSIFTSIGKREKTLLWRDIARIERDGDSLVITGRSGNAFIVPPSAFSNGHSIDSVYAQANEWHRAAS